MEDYKRGSHTVWDCKYHLAWTTKYRYEVLEGDVGQRCRELIREIARSQERVIYAGSINRDHVHMPIGIPPQISVSRALPTPARASRNLRKSRARPWSSGVDTNAIRKSRPIRNSSTSTFLKRKFSRLAIGCRDGPLG